MQGGKKTGQYSEIVYIREKFINNNTGKIEEFTFHSTYQYKVWVASFVSYYNRDGKYIELDYSRPAITAGVGRKCPA